MTANVVLVTGSLHGGGAERVLCEMANYWAKKGWEVTFATWSGPEIDDFYELDTGSNRVWLDVTTPANSVVGKARQILQRMITFRKLLVDLQPDAVLSFMNSSNVLTILAAAGLKTKVVVSERVQPSADPTVSSVVRFLRRITYPWSDEIVVQSKDAAKWIRRHCRKQATVISNPLRFLSQAECDRQPLIVSVGRLVNQKGFDLLLRAFAKIAPEYSDWNVAIVGEGC